MTSAGPAARIAADVRAGRTTAVAVVTDVLAAAERHADLGLWAHLDPDLALAEARRRDTTPAVGPLHGVPIAVKDIIDTADQPTAYGTEVHAGHRPARDAEVVRRLRAAGAIVVGKAVTTELALFHPGPTRNPHDPTRTPGGSSSGSAAAVAAGVVPLALGTQTAGSVVRPAGFCGVIGLKPTFGRVPVDGVRACAPDLDTVGGFARDVGDLALLLGVMAGLDRTPGLPPGPLRVGWSRTPWWDRVPVGTGAVLERGISALAGAPGLDLRTVTLPPSFDGLIDAQAALMRAEAAVALEDEVRDHGPHLSATLRDYLAGGPDPAAVAGGLAARDRALRDLDGAMEGLDVLIVPSVLGEAPDVGTTGDPALCRPWTLLGTPAVAVPGLVGDAGLPLGVQVVARPGDDVLALAAAGAMMARWAGAGPGDGGTW